MAYLDNTVDDATTYKGKLDESVTLLREPPVSTTSSGGTAGINYDVADWPGTLVSGRTYYVRFHQTNIAYAQVEGINVVRPDGKASQPLDMQQGSTLGLRYDGTNLVLPFVPESPRFTCTATGAADEFTELLYIRARASNADTHIKLLVFDEGFPPDGSCIVDLYFRENDASVPDAPAIDIKVSALQGGINAPTITHTSFYVDTLTQTNNIKATLFFGGVSAKIGYRVLSIFTEASSDNEVVFSNNAGLSAITNPANFEVQSQAARGEVVSGTYTTGSLSTGSVDLEQIDHGLGLDIVEIDIMVYGDAPTNPKQHEWEASMFIPGSYGKKMLGPATTSQTSMNTSGVSSGNVRIYLKNRASESNDFTVKYKITAC